uniref:Claudin n=1 Tax=Pinguiococcus pyrenoidosus TaxID=172671 RepID=A0A7R9U4Z7_9STRA
MASETAPLLPRGSGGKERVGLVESSVQDVHWAGNTAYVVLLSLIAIFSLTTLASTAWGEFEATTYACDLHVHLGLFAYLLQCGTFFEKSVTLNCRSLPFEDIACRNFDLIRALMISSAAFSVLALGLKVGEALSCFLYPTIRLHKIRIYRLGASVCLIFSGALGCVGVIIWCVLLERTYEKTQSPPFMPPVTPETMKSATLGWAAVLSAIVTICALAIGINLFRAACRTVPFRQVVRIKSGGNGLASVPEDEEEDDPNLPV